MRRRGGVKTPVDGNDNEDIAEDVDNRAADDDGGSGDDDGDNDDDADYDGDSDGDGDGGSHEAYEKTTTLHARFRPPREKRRCSQCTTTATAQWYCGCVVCRGKGVSGIHEGPQGRTLHLCSSCHVNCIMGDLTL